MRTAFIPAVLPTVEDIFKEHLLIANAANDDAKAALYKMITTADADWLLALALKDQSIDVICKHPQFDSHWQNVWRSMGLNPIEFSVQNKEPIHENQALVTVSCLDLLKGDYIYRQYRFLIANTEITPEIYAKAKEYLQEAANYGCFFAMNALCINGLKQLKDIKLAEDRRTLAKKILQYAEKAALLHFTPGYLLLSNVTQELYLYGEDLYPAGSPNIYKKTFFMDAAVALHVAQKMEAYSSSMINNAYQGKTIWKASHDTFSSWLHAKVRLLAMSGDLLNLRDMDEAAKQADLIVAELNKRYHFYRPISPVEGERVNNEMTASRSPSMST